MTKLRLPPDYAQLTKSQKLAIRSKGNISAALNPMRAYLRRRVLLRAEDRAAVVVGERLRDALVADKGDATAGETALAENAGLSRTLALICLREIHEKGDFVDTDAGRVASAALRELPKYLAAERQAIQAIGTSRRAAPALSLSDHMKARAEQRRDEAIPVEPVSVEAL